jgi:hypothetical protein
MLDLGNAAEISEVWRSTDSQAALPTNPEEFFGKAGPKQADQQRAYERHYLRCQAILRRECETHAIYMKDCSRTGMGIISPVQLFPRQRVQLWMSPQRSYSLEVVRCRRLGTNCYECGTIFILK